MKNIEEIDDNINELIMQKSFNELSADEKKKAVEYAGSEAQYNTLRATLLAITTSFGAEEEVFADSSLKNDLMSQFEKKFGKENTRVKVIPFYRQPLFQLAAAASVALLIFFSFPLLTNKEDKQGQLAMNNISKETPAKDAAGEPLESSTAITTETSKLEEKSEHATGKKTAADKIVTTEEIRGEETILNAPNNAGPLLGEEKEKADIANNDITDDNAAEDLKTTNKNLALTKPEKKKENDIFLLDKVTQEHREREKEAARKKKEKERMDELSKSENDNKQSPLELSEKDALVNAATGSAFETVPAPPGRITATITANHFLEQNNTAMMDLLFTTF
ncbi:MAG TPA: hypothetical protein VK177_07170 [Flavobacteriales bacterium]|nr:hypothetical protein [Flavobacteriales bacterium]